MKVRSFAVVVALAAGCGGESTKLEDRRGDGTGGNDDSGGSNNGGSNSGGSNSGGASKGGTNSTSGTSGSGGNGTGGVLVEPIYLYDEDNYRSAITLSIPTVETASGVDLEVCWSDVVNDLDCAEVDPENEIDGVSMIVFKGFSEEQILDKLASGVLGQADINGFISYETAHDSTCTKGSSLSNFGTAIDFSAFYVEDDDLKYIFTFTRGTAFGVGSVTMLFAKPTASSMNRELHAEPGCDLRTRATALSEPVPVPFEGPWIIDWSNVTRNGQGNPFNAGTIDTATLWFVPGVTPSEVEARIAELDRIATERYRLELTSGRSSSLTDMQSADGRAFASFSGAEDGVWLFGLACSLCLNAEIPELLAVFEPREAL